MGAVTQALAAGAFFFVLASYVVLFGGNTLSQYGYHEFSSSEARVINEKNIQPPGNFRLPPFHNVSHRLASRVPLDSLLNCSPTAQIEVVVAPTGMWMLKSLDETGFPKTVGGDEFYVSYRDASVNNDTAPDSAVAFVQDERNGWYSLRFVTVPMTPTSKGWVGHGVVTVHFQYTCGIGNLYPPEKRNWISSGAMMMESKIDVSAPNCRDFVPPSTVSLEAFDITFFLGDSVMEQLVQVNRQFFLSGRTYIRGNVGKELSSDTVGHFLRLLKRWHGKELRKPDRKIALVVGSSTWDILQPDNIQDQNWSVHEKACRTLIGEIRHIFPQVSLFWRTASAVHVHRLSPNCLQQKKCSQRTRYMSSSRLSRLHEIQVKTMRSMDVPTLDLFEAYHLSASHTYPGDGRHYKAFFNSKMLGWFFPNSSLVVP